MTTTTIALIRHGQTDWNLAGRIQGHTDIPLNATGIAQAEAASLALGEEPWHALLSSPLGRARHTAELIAAGLGMPEVRDHAGFLERNFGLAEGLVAGPELDAVRSDQAGGFVAAETPAAVAERGIAALTELCEQHPGQRLLVVSHGACIRITLQRLLGQDVPRILNAERTQLVHDGRGWQLSHLNGQLLTAEAPERREHPEPQQRSSEASA